MHIGVPKEIKSDERRVALTPAVVQALTAAGHQIRMEQLAGAGSGYSDADYVAAGAVMCSTAEHVWSDSELVVKVKEPLPEEYPFFRKGLTVFTYLHLAAVPDLAKALCAAGVRAIAYETVQTADGRLPLLAPMSEVAGRMAAQIVARSLEAPMGGRGVLMGGVPGVAPARIVIVGAGVVGSQAMQIAVGMGAEVTVFDRNVDRLRSIDAIYQGRVRTRYPHPAELAVQLEKTDGLIGAVLVPGARAPRVVSEAMVRAMPQGAVIVDVAIDQGGSVETIDRVTTHRQPTYERHGVLHYAVPNIPGAVPRTSTDALVNATFPFLERMAQRGIEAAVRNDQALARGVNCWDGQVVHAAVAEAVGLPYHAFV
jgi:alanine dehydrogenase